MDLAAGILPLVLLGRLTQAPGREATAGAVAVAVIVHPQNPVAGLSLDELVALCRMDRQHWRAGQRVFLILPESQTPEKTLLLDRVFQMDDSALKQFWLEKLYRGEIAAFPHVEPSGSAARRLVARAPNALALVDPSSVDSSVKVLRIEGRLPRELGYPLAGK